MRLIHALLISSMMSGLFACKCHKDAVKETASATAIHSSGSNTQNSPTATATSNSSSTTSQTTATSSSTNKILGDTVPTIYRVAVSFISMGAGTDTEARPLLDNYVQQFMDATSKRIVYDAHPWGREGEIDICFTLDNLTPEEQTRFINGVRETFKGRELVHIEENKKNNYRKK